MAILLPWGLHGIPTPSKSQGGRKMKKRFVWMLIVGALACVTWFMFARWLISLSANHDWLSSFVEIAFALNAALTFDKVRDYITPLNSVFEKKLKEMKAQHKGHRMQRKVLKYVDDNVHIVFAGLKDKTEYLLNWTVNFARMTCFVCVVALLVHGEGDNVAYIPALAFPSIFYCIGNLFLVFVVADDIVALFRDALRNCGVSVGQ